MHDELGRRARAAWNEALAELAADDRLASDVVASDPWLPPEFESLLARALATPERSPGAHALLLAHHTVGLQQQRAEVLAANDPAQRVLCTTPIVLAEMPRLARGLAGLFALVRAAGVDPARVFGAADPAAFVAARPTLAHLFASAYYGGFGPPLYTSPADLAALAREIGDGSAATARRAIDRRMAAPIVHELSHFQRGRTAIAPPYLDECVSGFIGICALPELAFPAPGDDGALFLAPWFGQVGEHVARVVGLGALVRAHAGVIRWDEVLPHGATADFEAMGWAQWDATRPMHFLGETTRPDPWIARLWRDVPAGSITAEDVALLARALRALTLAPYRAPSGAWRVRSERFTAGTGARFDPDTMRLARVGVAHELEGTPLHVVLSPPWRALGPRTFLGYGPEDCDALASTAAASA